LELDKYSISPFAFVSAKSFVVAHQNTISLYRFKKVDSHTGVISGFALKRTVTCDGNGRVRGLSVTPKNSSPSKSYLLASVTSDGLICIWDLDAFETPVVRIQTNAHLTCVAFGGQFGEK
jgi:hypothetical protein